jgi:site-specific DNA recombinase
MRADGRMVPLAGIEPALLAELDFESSASTSSATGAFGRPL